MEFKVSLIAPDKDSEFALSKSIGQLKKDIEFKKIPSVKVIHKQKNLEPDQAGGLMELAATILIGTQIPIKLIEIIHNWFTSMTPRPKLNLTFKQDGVEMNIESNDKKEIEDWLKIIKDRFSVVNQEQNN